MQMYCTFVLFVNQHFRGLPASETHCINIFCNLFLVFNLLCPMISWNCSFIFSETVHYKIMYLQ
jgi:hypothetical protein